MSLLDTISKPSDPEAVLVTIAGEPGIGKTSLAATFPKPIFIRIEDGMQSIPLESRPDAFPVVKNIQDLLNQLTALIKEEHSYKTVVIDSVTALEQLFIQYVIDEDVKKKYGTDVKSLRELRPNNINTALGGFGAGVDAVGNLHQRIRTASNMLINKGINIVFIAHATIINVELPDMSPFTRYSLRLGKKSIAPYEDGVDMVVFLKLDLFLTQAKNEGKKAKSDGTRIAVVYSTACNVAKNRYGIEEDIVVQKGINPFVEFIPALQEKKGLTNA